GWSRCSIGHESKDLVSEGPQRDDPYGGPPAAAHRLRELQGVRRGVSRCGRVEGSERDDDRGEVDAGSQGMRRREDPSGLTLRLLARDRTPQTPPPFSLAP